MVCTDPVVFGEEANDSKQRARIMLKVDEPMRGSVVERSRLVDVHKNGANGQSMRKFACCKLSRGAWPAENPKTY